MLIVEYCISLTNHIRVERRFIRKSSTHLNLSWKSQETQICLFTFSVIHNWYLQMLPLANRKRYDDEFFIVLGHRIRSFVLSFLEINLTLKLKPLKQWLLIKQHNIPFYNASFFKSFKLNVIIISWYWCLMWIESMS